MLHVFMSLNGAFVCFYESECAIKWNFVRQSGTLYVFESECETKWNFVCFCEYECETKWDFVCFYEFE